MDLWKSCQRFDSSDQITRDERAKGAVNEYGRGVALIPGDVPSSVETPVSPYDSLGV